MSYAIRSKDGRLKGKVDNCEAGKLMERFDGQWTEQNFVSGKENTFIFSKGFTFSVPQMTVYFFPTDYLVKIR